MKKILVVEDNEKHLQDAKELLEGRVQAGVPINVDYASTLDEALGKLHCTKYDGVMTDVFFSRNQGTQEVSSGKDVATYALENRIPFVMVTSTHHHGYKTEPINQWIRANGLELVDADYKVGQGETVEKNWAGGYVALMYFIEAVTTGTVAMSGKVATHEGDLSESEIKSFYPVKDILGNANDGGPKWGTLDKKVKGTHFMSKKPDLVLGTVIEKYCKGMFQATEER